MGWICLNDECNVRFFSIATELWETHNFLLIWAYNLIVNNFLFVSVLFVIFFITGLFLGIRRVMKSGI